MRRGLLSTWAVLAGAVLGAGRGAADGAQTLLGAASAGEPQRRAAASARGFRPGRRSGTCSRSTGTTTAQRLPTTRSLDLGDTEGEDFTPLSFVYVQNEIERLDQVALLEGRRLVAERQLQSLQLRTS